MSAPGPASTRETVRAWLATTVRPAERAKPKRGAAPSVPVPSTVELRDNEGTLGAWDVEGEDLDVEQLATQIADCACGQAVALGKGRLILALHALAAEGRTLRRISVAAYPSSENAPSSGPTTREPETINQQLLALVRDTHRALRELHEATTRGITAMVEANSKLVGSVAQQLDVADRRADVILGRMAAQEERAEKAEEAAELALDRAEELERGQPSVTRLRLEGMLVDVVAKHLGLTPAQLSQQLTDGPQSGAERDPEGGAGGPIGVPREGE